MCTRLKSLDHRDRDQTSAPEGTDAGAVNFDGEAGSALGRMESEKYVGYEPHRTRFESRWAPWGWSGNSLREERSRSPERIKIPTPETHDHDNSDDDDDDDDDDEDDDEDGDDDNDDVEEDGMKKLCESRPIPSPTPAGVDTAQEPAFRVGAGFTNLGNTCYLNAVLQCLVHTKPLVQGLFVIKHYFHGFSEFCLICTLRQLVCLSFSSLVEIAPYKIVDNLKYFSPDFARFQQEDAHEFMQCLFDKLEKYLMCSMDPFSVTPSDNLVKQLFGGSLVSKLRCSECNHISSKLEDLIDISLEIDDVNTLDGALDSFTKLEKIEGQLTCDRCNGKVSMEKQLMIREAPLVASFHLKRFKNDGTTVKKITDLVEYPLSLNLHPYTTGHLENNVKAGLIYDLYAVIVHSGYSSDAGHYNCYIRSSPSTWHKFDDSMVTEVSESYVLSREAYILFYAKHEVSWFSNAFEIQSLCHPIISPSSVLDNGNQFSESDSSTENPHKCDVRLNRNNEFSQATCQPACFGPQQMNTVESKGNGKYSSSLLNRDDNVNNEVRMDNSAFNLDVLLNAEEEKRTSLVDTNDSSLKFSMLKDEASINRKVVADKRSSAFSCDVHPTFRFQMNSSQERVDSTPLHSCSAFVSHNEDCFASPSLCEARNLTNKNLVSPGGASINSSSSQSCSCGSPENWMPRTRSGERPVEDPRKKHTLKTLKKTNTHMPMSGPRLSKKNKQAQVSPACGKDQDHVVNPSARPSIFR